MITVTVQNHNHFTTLTFPCSENEMEKKLEELRDYVYVEVW